MSRTAPAPKPDIRFAVTITDSRYNGAGMTQFRHFTARAYILGVDKYGSTGRPELLDPDEYGVPDRDRTRALKGLVVTAQADGDSMKRPDEQWYGWEAGYDRSGTIELRDAEEMQPVLRKIRKQQEKLHAEFGFPRTLALFCTYAARALTAERRPFLRRDPDGRDIEGNGGYRSMDTDALDSFLRTDAREWREAHGIKTDD
jgi:hypothetical protein